MLHRLRFQRMLCWLAVILWAGFIFYLSSIPGLETGLLQDFLLRKIGHMAVYFVLAVLFISALRIDSEKEAATLIAAALLSFLYAVSDEYHQTFVANRSGTALDVLIDGIGIAFALFSARLR